MLGYAVYMYLNFRDTEFPSAPAPHRPSQGPPSAALLGAAGAPAAHFSNSAYDPPPSPGPLPPPPPAHKLAFPWCAYQSGQPPVLVAADAMEASQHQA